MLRHGSEMWQLWLFGVITAPLGVLLWYGQGVHFGLGTAKGQVDRGIAYGSLVVFIALMALALLIGE